jgi:hypothetical protein
MDEILNHGYVSPSRARSATVSRRAFLAGGGLGSHAPFALDAPEPADSGDDAKRDAGGWEWDAPERQEEDFDPRFDDFPDLPRRRTFHGHPATRSELAGGLCPPMDDIGGHEIVGHHIERRAEEAAQGVPNYQALDAGAPAAYEPDVMNAAAGAREMLIGPWQTTAQAMHGGAQPAKRRTGKRMAAPAWESSFSLHDADAHALGRLRGFGPKPAPLAPRADSMHRNVDVRSGCGTETLPFVPGYGGYVPETRGNFAEAARRNLAKRQPKELLVENHNPRVSGCTKATMRRPF